MWGHRFAGETVLQLINNVRLPDVSKIRPVVGHVILGASGIAMYILIFRRRPKTIPMGDGWWGTGEKPLEQEEDVEIKPFQIKTSAAELQDLFQRLDHVRLFTSLEDSRFHYGFNPIYLQKIISYWRNEFDWNKQLGVLNHFPQYKTKIEGIDVHFVHVKPPHLRAGCSAKPLLMIHGWPGSFYEFYKVIPLLTDPSRHGLSDDVVFEVICPSIPGYGFSEAPRKKGFDSLAAARIFCKLMQRLGYKKFYLQGGDWGGLICQNIAQMAPENVLGLHLNFFPITKGGLGMLMSMMLGRYFPFLVGFTKTDVERTFPYFEKNVYHMLRETGYLHIQATKPDTAGCALNDSPAALAAYILEKFSTWTDSAFRDLEDGGLERKFSLDDLLTNVMIYWLTGSIVSSMRFYKENLDKNIEKRPDARVAVYSPTGLAAFPKELTHVPRVWAKQKYKNIVLYSYMSRGGHFAAFEEPDLLAGEIRKFVRLVEKS
ncbi:epoxide hydrolase 1-like isoform X2 [Protopterus annectens]|uniref:epoxide hydrolase 1-like isoform X2 n=1 Tax=Protopterus annectens TaxID=7888 RepID=UPI001CFB7F37|nr:epoxide hydrolase 1-like isoform X2 [Protopterus annectens]